MKLKSNSWSSLSLLIWIFRFVLFSTSTLVHADQRVDWNKIVNLVPSWPIVEIGEEIPSDLISHWESKDVSFKCPAKAGQYNSFPSKYGATLQENCDHLDSTLFNGLLCSSGYDEGCEAVKQAQGVSTGMWYRSPRNRWFVANQCERGQSALGAQYCSECGNTFSPDHGLGAMLYIVKTGGRAALKSWLGGIEEVGKSTKLCKEDGSCQPFPWPRICANDNKCIVKNADGTINQDSSNIPQEIGGYTSGMCILQPVKDTPDYDLVALKMNVNLGPLMVKAISDGDALMSAIFPVPGIAKDEGMAAWSSTNFPLHLEATRVLLRMLINNPELKMNNLPVLPDPSVLINLPNSAESSLDPIAINLRAKTISAREPWNPFYKLLSDGPTTEVRQKILDLCPASNESLGKDRSAWLWRWETNKPEEFTKDHSMGWDCVFVGRLYNKMRVKKDFATELLDLWLKYTDSTGDFLSRLSQSLQLAEGAYIIAQQSLDLAKHNWTEAHNFIDSEYSQTRQSLVNHINDLNNQQAQFLIQQNELRRQAAEKIKEASLLPDNIEERFERTVCRALPWPLNEVCDKFVDIKSIPNKAKTDLLNAAVDLNNQVTDLENNAIRSTRDQISSSTQAIADLDAKRQLFMSQIDQKVLDVAVDQAKTNLDLQSKVMSEARSATLQVKEVHDKAIGYLAVWRRN